MVRAREIFCNLNDHDTVRRDLTLLGDGRIVNIEVHTAQAPFNAELQ